MAEETSEIMIIDCTNYAMYLDEESGISDYLRECIINVSKRDVDFKMSKDWIYIGGNKCGYHANKDKYSSLVGWVHGDVNKCICGIFIVENCYIYNDREHVVMVIGNSCVKRYTVDGTKKTCDLCRKNHLNRKDNMCNQCRIIVAFGKYKDQSVFYLLEDTKYIKWLVTEDWFQDNYASICKLCIDKLADIKNEPLETKTISMHKVPIKLQKIHIDGICDECFGKCDIKYEICYTCKKPNKCIKCGKPCPIQYETCYACKK
jgi:hypothetical protein